MFSVQQCPLGLVFIQFHKYHHKITGVLYLRFVRKRCQGEISTVVVSHSEMNRYVLLLHNG